MGEGRTSGREGVSGTAARGPIPDWQASRAEQWLAVLATGLLMTLAFPFQVWSLALPASWQGYTAWVAFAPLLYVARGLPARRVGLLFGGAAWAYFAGTLFWVVVAMYEYGHVPLAFSLLGLLLLSLVLGLFHALAGYLAARGALKHGWSITWLAALALTGVELSRNYVLTGFPWSNPAYSQTRFLSMIQIADLTGIYGLTFLIVLVGGALASLAHRLRGRSTPWLLEGLVCLMLLAGVWAYGQVRLQTMRVLETAGTPLKVGLLQGNIPQDEKWQEEKSGQILGIFAEQVRLAQAKGAELILWPEAAIPHLVQDDIRHMRPDAFPLEGPGVHHIIGAPVYQAPVEGQKRLIMHNSAFLVGPDRRILGRYDKSHLVPFGEYVPLQRLLFFLGPLVEMVGDFKPGQSVTPLTDGRHRYGVLICYEDIFPEISREMARNGADLLVNATNDAWYGPTSAPMQHLDMVVFRAVETRLPAARAANTGISAFVDATGKVLEQTRTFVPAVVVRELKLARGRSPYLVVGDAFAYACVALLGLALGWPRRKEGQAVRPR